MKNLLFILSSFLLLFTTSCQKNYTKELQTISQEVTSGGKQILYVTKNVTDKEHCIVYREGVSN